jgi:hypothetical protein
MSTKDKEQPKKEKEMPVRDLAADVFILGKRVDTLAQYQNEIADALNKLGAHFGAEWINGKWVMANAVPLKTKEEHEAESKTVQPE